MTDTLNIKDMVVGEKYRLSKINNNTFSPEASIDKPFVVVLRGALSAEVRFGRDAFTQLISVWGIGHGYNCVEKVMNITDLVQGQLYRLADVKCHPFARGVPADAPFRFYRIDKAGDAEIRFLGVSYSQYLSQSYIDSGHLRIEEVEPVFTPGSLNVWDLKPGGRYRFLHFNSKEFAAAASTDSTFGILRVYQGIDGWRALVQFDGDAFSQLLAQALVERGEVFIVEEPPEPTPPEALTRQCRVLLRHLHRGSITQRQALMDLSIAALPRRIADLREAGYPIERVMKKNPLTGQRYASYYLAA